ncbi:MULTISPECIES: HIT family protein [Arthrobacter]|uniref:HIT family protein n=1 Tax=Arthrobacter jinronghuae TaxID=2964609 RepID=A0ABT1NSL7_9MICC|nr:MULTISPECIES: HIT family protein [Arthrobacter]MCQ1949556.1 HIT family protein [Arthrobacter jinronghuae]MCQ1952876.1 HIT family protein [Arthrobacter sp. zg-Y238]MCQ1955003.1 HIT family protein [Arthrobacter jinronghuae]UWX77678.1 HIT family protein [Arthrobacter jinronghuae]
MPTLFTRIINGEIPGHFVWKDDDVVAFLSIGPLSDGHTLVVPREEINKWTDAPAELMQKLITVAQTVGQAQVAVFGSERAGLTIAGFEVDHLHLHVWPADSMQDFDFSRAESNPDPERMAANAEKLRQGLRDAGHGEFVPEA